MSMAILYNTHSTDTAQKEMLEEGAIEPSSSEWTSLMVIVKKDNSI